MIGRYSYPLIELGCPPTRGPSTGSRPNGIVCAHSITAWVDRDWLLILAAAYQSPDAGMRAAIEKGRRQRCLSWERLHRLRLELDFIMEGQPWPSA